MKRSTLLLFLIIVSVLLTACNPVGGEVTTSVTTDPAPETSVITPETTAPETDETATGEVTAEKAPETTAPPSVFEAKVYVYDALGRAEEYIIKSTTLPSAALESVDLTVGDGVRTELVGWECSVTKDGERRPYDVNDPPFVTLEGMHIYPILEYSYRVRFLAGEGSFPEGTVTEFFVRAGERVSAAELLRAMPTPKDGEADRGFSGFICDGAEISAEAAFTVERAMTFTAVYIENDAEYEVLVRTEYGELPSGGTTAEFRGRLADAEGFVSKYENHNYPDIRTGGLLCRYAGATLEKNGRSWTLELKWELTSVGFTLVLDHGDGQQAVHAEIPEGERMVLPTLDRREGLERYYDFVGWRDVRGHLYNGGYELTVTEDMTFKAEFTEGAKRVYSVVFDTEIGVFPNGSPVIVIEGFYGDPLTPPAPPETSELTFGEVVYEFIGWSGEIPTSITDNLSFTALYKTEKTVYHLNLYIDGELYLSLPHYAEARLTAPEISGQELGRVFSGWDMPEYMPESDLELYATTRDPEVVYILDCEIVSRIPTKSGTLVTLAESAHKYGHTVSGWSTANIGDIAGNSFTMPSHDVFFDATSVPNRHTVRYVIDGVEVYCDGVLYGETYTVRGIEVRIGHIFTGWSCSDARPCEPGGIIAIPDADIIFIGSFERCEYKVCYYLDGELLYSDAYFYGDRVTLRADEEQQGCVFAWHSAGADISLGSFMMPAGDVDIYGIFSSGDNRIYFVIDGVEYGSISVSAGERVDLGYTPTRGGYTFSGWSCDEVDSPNGIFIMPEGDIVLRGSFIPNTHEIVFTDIATGAVISTGSLDYGSRFSLGDRVFCLAGLVSEGWVLLDGHAVLEGDGYVMPDSDVIFGIVWEECLTVEVEEGYHVPYYALAGGEYNGCRYNGETKTVYISDPAVKVNGASEGVSVVYEYEVQ